MSRHALKTVAEPAAGSNETEAVVGRRIRALRRSRDLSLQTVSVGTGMSIGLLSQIERGLSSPSLRNLIALSAALGVGIGWFFEEDLTGDENERNLVVRRRSRPRVAMQAGSSVSKELLSPARDRPLQMFMLRIEPGGGTGDVCYSNPGEVGGYVLSGRLALWLQGKHFVLEEGDSFSIPSQCPRRYSNPDRFQETQVVWSIAYPP